MLLAEAVPIPPRATAAELHDVLADLGARLILRVLADPPPPVPQPDEGATYAPRLRREDGRIDWTRDAAALDRQVRAFTPWPGSFTMLGGRVLKVLAALAEPGEGPPGTVLAPGAGEETLRVACGTGVVAADPGATGRRCAAGHGRVPPRPSGAAGDAFWVTRRRPGAGRCWWNTTAPRSSAGSARRAACRCRKCWKPPPPGWPAGRRWPASSPGAPTPGCMRRRRWRSLRWTARSRRSGCAMR